jgi:imidazolonepropionase
VARRCSFCGEDRRGVDRLIAGHGGVAICGDCARLAAELSSVPDDSPTGDLLLVDIGTLVTNDPRHGGLLGRIEGAAVAVRNGRITWLGRQRALPDRYRELPEVECGGRMVAPGFIDAHRHLEARSDLDLAGFSDLVVDQVGIGLEQGTTTQEMRTWAAPDPETDVMMLSAVRVAGETIPTDTVPTVVVGTDPPARGRGYRSMVESVLLPTAARVAGFVDLVVGGPLPDEDAASVMSTARRIGLGARVHVHDAGALAVAFEGGAVSIDGMWGMEDAAEVVVEARTVVVSLPATSWMMGRPDPARAMWDAGATVAIGTGCEGGTVATMPLAMSAAVYHGGIAPERALWSATRGGALALREPDKGRVALGSIADLVVIEAETAADIVTEPGRDPVSRVVKDGVPLGT